MKYIETTRSVKPLGPYSQAVSEKGLIFVSGVLGMDPTTNALVAGGIKEQTARALENMKGVLEEGGSSLQKVLKVTIFLKEGGLFKDMNEVYASFLGNHKPARSTVVCGFAKEGALVCIDAIASV